VWCECDGRASSGVVYIGASAAKRDAQAKSRAARFKSGSGVCTQPYEWQ
jgi:hypothetical protein